MDTLIRKMTRQAYDVQKFRISCGLRIVSQFRNRFGAEEQPLTDIEAEERKQQKLLAEILKSYEKAIEGVKGVRKRSGFVFDSIVCDETDIWFIESYVRIFEEEKTSFKRLEKMLDRDPFYNSYLKKVKGIGPAMAGVLLSELNPYAAKYPSSFWKYAGLDVIAVFDKETHELVGTEGRCRREHHLIAVEYVDRKGETKIRRGLSYNPWLKSKLLAVLATSFLRAGNEKYVKLYQDYKFRQLNRPELKDNPAVKIISHKRALRYMIKQFLVDLHMAWRLHEGLEVFLPYAEAKLGLTHGVDSSVEEVGIVNRS